MSKRPALFLVLCTVVAACVATWFGETALAVTLVVVSIALARPGREDDFVTSGPQRYRFSDRIRDRLR